MRNRVFPGRGPEVEAKYRRASNWFKATIFENDWARDWCKTNGVPVVKAAAEGIDSAGGFLVPLELATGIMDIRDTFGAMRRRARIVPMASDNTNVPRRPGGTGAYFTAENTAMTQDIANVSGIALTAKKIATQVLLSSEIEEDSLFGMVDFIGNEIAFAFAAKEDDCAFNGDGTSTYGGMFGISNLVLDGNHSKAKVTAASGHNTFLLLDTTDLGSLVAAVQAAAIPRAAWFCSVTCFAQTFCRLAGSGGGGYLYVSSVDGIDTPHYLGFPVIFTQKLPLISTPLSGKVMLAFGDMYLAGALGERRGITLARSADRYLDSDQITVRGTERFDITIHDAGDNTNFGAIAALVAP